MEDSGWRSGLASRARLSALLDRKEEGGDGVGDAKERARQLVRRYGQLLLALGVLRGGGACSSERGGQAQRLLGWVALAHEQAGGMNAWMQPNAIHAR